MPSYANFSAVDRDKKSTSLRIKTDPTTTVGEIATLAGAFDGVTLSTGFGGSKMTEEIGVGRSNVYPTVGEANRGKKWLLRTQYVDIDGATQVTNNLVGIADHSLLAPGIDSLDLTAGAGAALKTAWEAVFLSPDNTAGVLIEAKQVTVTD
jgi:hypothetical protein